MKKLLSIAATSFCLISFAAHAGNRPGALTFNFGGGYDFFASKRQIENTGVGLIGLGYDLTDRWGIEGLLGAFSTHFNNDVNDDRRIDGTLFAIDGVYRFLSCNRCFLFEPFVLAGVGVIGMNPSRSDAHNEGNVNFGIGTQYFIDRSIAFRVDARDFYTIVGGKNDVVVDVGMSFLFDLC